MESQKNHLGVEIFNILISRNPKTILQKEIIRILEDKNFKKHKIYLYLRYILVLPLPLDKGDFLGIPIDIETEPMIIRNRNSMKNEVFIELNEEWYDVSEKDVIELFNKYNPDNY